MSCIHSTYIFDSVHTELFQFLDFPCPLRSLTLWTNCHFFPQWLLFPLSFSHQLYSFFLYRAFHHHKVHLQLNLDELRWPSYGSQSSFCITLFSHSFIYFTFFICWFVYLPPLNWAPQGQGPSLLSVSPQNSAYLRYNKPSIIFCLKND